MNGGDFAAFGTAYGPLFALVIWVIMEWKKSRKDAPAPAHPPPDPSLEKLERILTGQDKITEKMEKIADQMAVVSERLAVAIAKKDI